MEIEETIEIHFLLVICSNSIKMNIMKKKKKKKKEKKKEKKYENKNKTNNKKMQTIVVIFVIK